MEQVAIGRRDDTHIDIDIADAADPPDLFFLEGTQYLCLQGYVEFADLIQKQRAVMGDLKKSFLFGYRTRERTLFVAKG